MNAMDHVWVKAGKPGSPRRWGQYVWLAYGLFFFVEPVLRGNLTYWLQCLGIFALFLAVYVAYVETKNPRLHLPLVLGIIAFGVLTIGFNQGASFFFIFGGALLPFATTSTRTAVILLVSDAALVWPLWLVYRGNPINFAIAGVFTLVVGGANLFIAEQMRADCKLRAAQQENVSLAAVAERERIARDLHDVLGHTLSVIVLKAELAGRLMGRDNARAAAEIADVERTARTALAEVREAIGGYRARGLVAEVEQARQTLDAAGVALTCETRPPRLRAKEETTLSLALREAVTNIVRHAQATECSMRFGSTLEGCVLLEVTDNGARRIEREGNGLRGMRERVEELGGRMRIDSTDGTRLVIELPAGELG